MKINNAVNNDILTEKRRQKEKIVEYNKQFAQNVKNQVELDEIAEKQR